jgi:hypothetical protein
MIEVNLCKYIEIDNNSYLSEKGSECKKCNGCDLRLRKAHYNKIVCCPVSRDANGKIINIKYLIFKQI